MIRQFLVLPFEDGGLSVVFTKTNVHKRYIERTHPVLLRGIRGLSTTDMRRLTMGIRSEKCVVRRFRRCANVIHCTYTNLGSRV